MDFKVPDAAHIQEALGIVRKLPKEMQFAITRKVNVSFQPVPKPEEDDWLTTHEVIGQTMKSFEHCTSKAIPRSNRNLIYIQPIGRFASIRTVSFNILIEFVRIFYPGCQVELLPTIDIPADFKYREKNGVRQYRTKHFYEYLIRTRHQRNRQRELLCVAVTMVDIYLNRIEDWIYGEARKQYGLAVYSFARLDPLYTESSPVPISSPLTDEHLVIMIRRCVKVLLHELGHLFGLKHCIYYVCLMNGVNNEKEMDHQPLYLCPVCLRKLYATLRFDVRDVYKKFADVCAKYKLDKEHKWYRERLEIIDDSQ